MSFVQIVNDRNESASGFIRQFSSHSTQWAAPVRFAVLIASTQTSDIPGVSAAGATPAMCRFTPALDAEALVLGRLSDGRGIPVSPLGVVSPVVLTRACVQFLSCEVNIFDCGSCKSPAIDLAVVGSEPGKMITSGRALNPEQANKLFQKGLRYGKQLASDSSCLVISECVPGGTTTALGVLTALGFGGNNLVSGSSPKIDHDLKNSLVREGLDKAKLRPDQVNDNPLLAVAAVGDPMQPFACGLAISASAHVPVILGGGSQMLAVYALIRRLEETKRSNLGGNPVVVATTKWVAFDPSADTQNLSRIIGVPCIASCPDFSKSRHHGLRAYEDGHVKEGVGAGAAMALAHICAGKSEADLLAAIDNTYDELVYEKVFVAPQPVFSMTR